MSDQMFDWDDRKRLLDWWYEGRAEARRDGVRDDLRLTYSGLVYVAQQVEAATREVLEASDD
ncbi:hypothetical protein [Curtobacterium sp. MCBD17_021]|uniref:hypothetical protein n=1 Tax=Curtobacterium sp. MCBD17_021 TaxID=2175665 RepID=UPI000DA99A31|nr:hypothetical protein [Curtobacterium sp. MCBD17_021]PZE66911.1 hypothetical protein DEI83_06275 [Curtobacterium sp. MCBD17_021]